MQETEPGLVSPPKASVLLAEDDQAIREMFKFGLAHSGYSVRTATDGQEAVAALRESEPDLVLLDVQMPRLNGFGVLEALDVRLRRHPHVIMLSNLSQPEDVRRGVDLGAIDWIIKSSVSPGTLARRIEQWIGVIARYGEPATPIDRTKYLDPEGRSFEASPNGMLVADDFARYLDANERGLELLGCDLPELVRRSVWDVTPNHLLLDGIAMWREFLTRGEDAGSYEVIDARGRTRAIRYLATANVEPGRHLSVHIG